MTGPKDPQNKDPQKESRARRLSAALRDNLKRRKAQARGRDAGRNAGRDEGGSAERAPEPASPRPPSGTHDSAEFAENNKRNS
ncbi:MAG: hypothetical protein GEU95_10850 [Rhizobiales bacterium]|nr:hypothetical protein [Hyphomicrobiales bacterium]